MESWLREILMLIPGGTVFALAVFTIAFLEALIGVGLVIPGSVLTVFSGWLVLHGKGEISVIMAAAATGAMLGDFMSYWLGARFGPQLWNRGLLRKRRDLLRITELFFFEHGGKSVLLGRFIGPIRGLVPFVAGAARMSVKPFCIYTAIGGVLWGICYPGFGYLGGTGWQQVETLEGRLGWLMLLVISAGLVVWWLRRHFLPDRGRR